MTGNILIEEIDATNRIHAMLIVLPCAYVNILSDSHNQHSCDKIS